MGNTTQRVLFLTEESDRAEAALMEGVYKAGRALLVAGQASSSALGEIARRGVPVQSLAVRSRFDFGAVRELKHVIAQFRPTLVHAFTSRTLSVATLALWGSATARIGYRGTAGHLSRLNPADWLTYLHPTLARIMCVSDAVRHSLIDLGVPANRLATIYKGHSMSWYSSSSDGRAPRAALEQFGIPAQALVIGCNANMRPVKGIDVLLRAARSLPMDGSIHYLLVGEVRDDRVATLASDPQLRPIVHTPGFRSDGAALMRACDIFVLPSRAREGLPKALLEAMAGGTAVVASAVGGIPEVIRHEVDGLLVPPQDASALAAALQKLLSDSALRQRLAASAKQRIACDFSVEQSVLRLLAMYDQLPDTLAAAVAPLSHTHG